MKIIAKIIIIITVFIFGFAIGQRYVIAPSQKANLSTNNQQTQEEKTANLMLDFGNGDIKAFNNIVIKDGATTFELVKEITSENNIEFGYKDYGGDLGVLVESIGEKKNNFDAGYYWQYWVNNDYAKVGAGVYKLKNNDIVEWKYTKGQITN